MQMSLGSGINAKGLRMPQRGWGGLLKSSPMASPSSEVCHSWFYRDLLFAGTVWWQRPSQGDSPSQGPHYASGSCWYQWACAPLEPSLPQAALQCALVIGPRAATVSQHLLIKG